MRLSGIDGESFLRGHWQKAPLLVRGAWDGWENPLDPDELAGLALEPEVEARIVTRSGDDYLCEHGPFSEDRFAALGTDPWTLMVQAVDHQVPAVAALLDHFRFVPNWRVDDVLVTYAAEGGGVGPHFDNYDVFLIQGMGQRRWRIGGPCSAASPLREHDDLRLLEGFDTVAEWVLEPGDMLYLPPGIAHEGVAIGDDCMTYSVGFRAPSQADLVAGWLDSLRNDPAAEDARYRDPGLAPQDNPGEIAPQALAALHRMIADALADADGFAKWFGAYATAPRNPHLDWSPVAPLGEADVCERLAARRPILRNPAMRFAFIRDAGDSVSLFVGGTRFACAGKAAALAERLCAAPRVETQPGDLSVPVVALVTDLHARGAIAFEADA